MTRQSIARTLDRLTQGQRKALRMLVGVVAGATVGYVIYGTIGCSSGGCAITSDPLVSMAWGSLVGGFTAAG